VRAPAAMKTSAKKAPATVKPTKSDRAVIAAFFRGIDGRGIIALPPSRSRVTQSAGHEDAVAIARERRLVKPSYVFWHQQAERAFDREGALVADLYLHWGGDQARIAAALAALAPRYTVVDGGPKGAFRVRIVSEARAATGSLRLPDVKRRLADIYDALDQDRTGTLAFLHEVMAAPLAAVHLAALSALAGEGEATREELDALATRLFTAADRELVRAGDDVTLSDWLVTVLSALRPGNPAAYTAARTRCESKRGKLHRVVALRLAADEPYRSANEARLRAGLTDGDLWVRTTAALGMAALKKRTKKAHK